MKPGTAVIRALSKADADKYADFNLTVESASRPPEPERPDSSSSSSSSDAGSYKPSEPAKPAEPSVKVENGKIAVQAKREQGSTVAKAVITAEALDQALKDAQPDNRGVKKVRIEVAADKEATGVDVSMSAAALTGSGLQQQYEMVTPQAIVTVPSNMISKDAAKDAKTISIVIGQSDRGSWPAALSAKVGERPAVTVELKADGKPLSGMRAGAPMLVAIPYKPTARELALSHSIIIWAVDTSGRSVAVPSAKYDAATGIVRFETMQLGTYAVGFNIKEFADTGKLDWAKVSIEALAARGIIDGVDENRFAPQLDITRGDFTVMLVRALGLQASGGGSARSGADSGFADVNADAYYAEVVGMAKELGFVQGKGDNAFGPRDAISRQDMFTMVARALEKTGMLKVDGDSDALAAYTDSAQVSDYAKGSLAGLLQEGLLQGSRSKLHPDSRATRAEVAVFLNRVHNRVYE